ncbi:MAG: LysR family transcriptional regulator [Nesterenkonia sp.]|uniref:LysR family transcriptional regulator n=1 Tax=Nesterenkonia marinintestina TaxID=2979865 RepID=UPI0021BEEA01|nr:LysR family transcriptional regulator [Nesterenkonia sp. GX14115]MDO5493048.1 LysR family transcriptional regulator [Nesterenkonia sp.]
MEVQQARAFIAVAEELHFGRAAERLRLTQSALSRSLAQLERSLGTQLVERTTRTVQLTSAGEALLPHAQEIVALVDRSAEIVAAASAGRTGRVRLGFAGPSTNHVVGLLARELRRRLPGLRLELVSSLLSHKGLDQVLDGSLDIALGRWDLLPADVTSMVITQEDLVLAMPEGHRLARHSRVGMRQLARDSWIVLPSGPGAALPQRLHVLAGQAGFVPRITQIAPDSATSMVLVASGFGVALTQSSVQRHIHAPGVVFRELSDAPRPLAVRLIWRRDDPNPALAEVVETAQALHPSTLRAGEPPSGH